VIRSTFIKLCRAELSESSVRNLLFAGSLGAAGRQQIPLRLRRFGMTKGKVVVSAP